MPARAKYLDDLQALLKADRVARFAYAEDLTKKSDLARDAIDLWRTWWRDVLLAEQRQFGGIDQHRSRGADSGAGATAST